MLLLPENFYHIINRGIDKKNIFFKDKNYYFFLNKVRKHMLPYCHILSYCLMPNHFHIQISTKSDLKNQKLNNSIGNMLSSYTQAINKQENRTGSLLQQNTKAKCLTENIDNSDSKNNEYHKSCRERAKKIQTYSEKS